MILKSILIVYCLVFLVEANKFKNFYVDEIVKQVCKGDASPKCTNTAKMCIPPFNGESLEQMKANHCTILKTCTDKITGARPIFETYIKETRGGRDMCAKAHGEETRPKPIGELVEQIKGKKQSFEEFLIKNSGRADMASDFKCCVANEKGKFNSDGTVNVAAWKAEAVKFVDPEVKTAFENGVDACATSAPVCDVIAFKVCAVSKCYDSMKSKGVHA